MTRWYGKGLGLAAGWLLTRHPDGILLGLLLGHAWDAGWFRRAPAPAPVPVQDGPYRVLGLDADASDTEIEQAYRRLIAQYHPDRLVGIPDDLRRLAEQKAGEINAAYDRIRKQRRMR